MLRLFPDKYRLSLAVDAVSVTKLRCVFPYLAYTAGVQTVHPVVADTAASHNTADASANSSASGSAAPTVHAWQTSLEALEPIVAGFKPGSVVTVVLANQFVRYLILPAMPAFTSMNERISMATQCFRETYGESAEDWAVRVNPLPHGDSMLCCAVDQLLIRQLKSLLTGHQLKLSSLQPSFMHGFNAARRQMRSNPACFVQLERGRVNIALIRDGAWQSLSVGLLTAHSLSSNAQLALLDMVSRELLLAGWQPEQCSALTVYIDTSFVVDSVQHDHLDEHRLNESQLDQNQLNQNTPQHGSPEHAGWQLVYLTQSNQTNASQQSTALTGKSAGYAATGIEPLLAERLALKPHKELK